MLDGLWTQETGRVRVRLEALDAREADVRERAALQRDRPEGCACLGTGGVGTLIAVLSGGLPIFSAYCACPEGEQARDAAAWAHEAVLQLEADTAASARRERERVRVHDLLSRAGIEQRYEVCTFENLRALLVGRGLMTDALSDELALRETAYRGALIRGDFIWGDPGHGKTSAAISALRAWIEQGKSGRFISEGDFLDAVHASMGQKDGSGDALVEFLKTVPLLVFDDLAMMVRTAYDRGRIAGLITARHAANLPTIFTSNYPMRAVAYRLSDNDDGHEVGRLEGRLQEMCDAWKLVTGQLRSAERMETPSPAGLHL